MSAWGDDSEDAEGDAHSSVLTSSDEELLSAPLGETKGTCASLTTPASVCSLPVAAAAGAEGASLVILRVSSSGRGSNNGSSPTAARAGGLSHHNHRGGAAALNPRSPLPPMSEGAATTTNGRGGTAAAAALAVHTEQRPVKALVAEDDALVRRVMQIAIRQAGIEARFVQDGLEATGLLAADPGGYDMCAAAD